MRSRLILDNNNDGMAPSSTDMTDSHHGQGKKGTGDASRGRGTRTRSSTMFGPYDSRHGQLTIEENGNGLSAQSRLNHFNTSDLGRQRPPMLSHSHHGSSGHVRTNSEPTSPIKEQASPDKSEGPLLGTETDKVLLSLYTYNPSATTAPTPASTAHSLLPAPAANLSSSRVLLSYASLPWDVKPGDYFEIRRTAGASMPVRPGPHPLPDERSGEGDALEGVKPGKGRDGYIFRLREDMTNVPLNQIQVPNSVAQAFKLQHRQDVQVRRIADPTSAQIDFIELHFSQYVGRADMWRLGMSLENTTVHVGEKVTLAGGAVRADVQGIWRGRHRYSSGIVTAKTKTIYRSRSSQFYIFIQLSRETWEFDEDGERYYEKVLHGFLPDLFQRWCATGASHLVTIVLFARVYYDDDEVRYMERNDCTLGLMKDHSGKYCKDFFRVVVDFERKADWSSALAEIKQTIQQAEKEVFLMFNIHQMSEEKVKEEQKRVIGQWSFAYEGNILEAINLALNPFDEHYIDRDLSRTGLSITILTPGTGHFNVDKNLLRLTTERMIDHGVGLDLVCMTKMPLHSVPLFSYMSERPKRGAGEDIDGKAKPATPDPLYFDANMSHGDRELTQCYSLAFWVYCSYYSKTHDKPFRRDQFIPRCKMYEIQMMGILDHNLTTVIVPLLDVEDMSTGERHLSPSDRKHLHDDYDQAVFGGPSKPSWSPKETLSPPSTTSRSGISSSLGASYQSHRYLSNRMEEEPNASKGSTPGRASRASRGSVSSIVEAEEAFSQPSLPEMSSKLLGSSSTDMPDMPIARESPAPVPVPTPARQPRRLTSSSTERTPSSRIISMTSIDTSPTQSVTSNDQLPSGASTPRMTPARRLKNQSSRGSFASRFASSWLFGSFGTRASPSVATAAQETVERQDVSTTFGASKPSSPSVAIASPLPTKSVPQPVPGARARATPSPARARPVPKQPTQPMPIMSHASRTHDHEAPLARSMPRSMPRSIPRSLQHSVRLGRSMEDSWRNKTNAAFGRTTQHRTINPCNPKESISVDGALESGHGRRWQHVRPRMTVGKQHAIKWRSLCVPACLPLTTDFMPTPEEIGTYYEAHSYDIACFPDQVSFLIRPDAAQINLPLAVMREMASQRLSQNFQFIVLPHNTITGDDSSPALGGHAQKNLLLGDSTSAGLRVGGASEVLKDANGAIYLSWSNHVHRLTFDPQKQSVTVQRFVRKIRHSTPSHAYKCLVWPYQLKGLQEATAIFRYPNIDARLNFNYLDRLIAGEEDQLQSNLRFWRARYLLIPSGRDPTSVQGLMPRGTQGEEYNTSEILITGAVKVLELMGRNQWKRPGTSATPLRLLATTFDPSTSVLDEGLMLELERLTSGKEKIDAGHTLEGMTLQAVADMMNKPNNGLIIRDRWWNFNMHEDSFTGEQFCQWLMSTFSDVQTREQAVEWGQSLFEKGLIEHVTGVHAFHDTFFFYRLRAQYDKDAKPHSKSWFSKAPVNSSSTSTEPSNPPKPKAKISTSPVARASMPRRLADKPAKKRKVKMSQSIIVDLDPSRKSDRAEVAILHADIIHNSRNAFHFELNWLGVTAGLLDDLRAKCAMLAERYGLRFVEAPVEQIKDVGQKCVFRAPIPIKLALAPPAIPDLHQRLAESTGSGQTAHFFEYAILTQKFGFVLDLEASERYPETIEVEYAYRSKAKFEHSQFVHRTGLALVQCVGREQGFLWADNRPFISAPTRGRQQSVESHAGVTPMASKQEQARTLREEFEAFCSDPVALADFYEEITPALPEQSDIEEEGEEAEERSERTEKTERKVSGSSVEKAKKSDK